MFPLGRIGIRPRRAIGLALILGLLSTAFPALAADCDGCTPAPRDCCRGKQAGCGENPREVVPIGCCTPRELPPAPATDPIPVPAHDADRLYAAAPPSTLTAVREAVAIPGDRSVPNLPHDVLLFTFHSVLLI